jgi:hypothetical protein
MCLPLTGDDHYAGDIGRALLSWTVRAQPGGLLLLGPGWWKEPLVEIFQFDRAEKIIQAYVSKGLRATASRKATAGCS